MKRRIAPMLIWAIPLVLLPACKPAVVLAEATPVAPPATAQRTPTITPASTHKAIPSPTSAADEHVIWKFQTGGAIWGSPAFYDGVVFTGSDDGNLYAVEAGTGKKKWAFSTEGLVRSRPAFDASQEDAHVFFTSDEGYIYALKAGNGEQVWRMDIGNGTDQSVRKNIDSSPEPTGYDYVQSSPVFSEGRVYVGSADGNIYALKADTGEVLWTYQTGAQVRATPTIANGTVYVGSWDRYMYALKADTGELAWQTLLGGQIQTTALVSENLVYTASRKASVVALDNTTGKLQWEFYYGQNMWVESSPVLVDSMLYIGSSGSHMIFGLDKQTGDKKLAHVIGQFCWSRPLIVDQSLYIGCTNFDNPRQGLLALGIGPQPTDENSLAFTPEWQLPTGKGLDISGKWSGVASSPLYVDGVIYFGGLDGVLYAVLK